MFAAFFSLMKMFRLLSVSAVYSPLAFVSQHVFSQCGVMEEELQGIFSLSLKLASQLGNKATHFTEVPVRTFWVI